MVSPERGRGPGARGGYCAARRAADAQNGERQLIRRKALRNHRRIIAIHGEYARQAPKPFRRGRDPNADPIRHRLPALRAVGGNPSRDRCAGAAPREIQFPDHKLPCGGQRAADAAQERANTSTSRSESRCPSARTWSSTGATATPASASMRGSRSGRRSPPPRARSRTPPATCAARSRRTATESHGRVARFLAGEDSGFIETADGREIYFHRNAVLNGGFARLSVGSEVRFVEEEGEKGAQASTVRLDRQASSRIANHLDWLTFPGPNDLPGIDGVTTGRRNSEPTTRSPPQPVRTFRFIPRLADCDSWTPKAWLIDYEAAWRIARTGAGRFSPVFRCSMKKVAFSARPRWINYQSFQSIRQNMACNNRRNNSEFFRAEQRIYWAEQRHYSMEQGNNRRRGARAEDQTRRRRTREAACQRFAQAQRAPRLTGSDQRVLGISRTRAAAARGPTLRPSGRGNRARGCRR